MAAPRRLDHTFVGFAALSPDGRWALTGTHNGRGVRISDTDNGKVLRSLLPQDMRTVVGIRPDGQQFVTSTRDGPELGTIWWEAESWKELRRIPEHGPFAWSPDGRLFAQSPDNYRVRLLDGEGKRELATFEAPEDVQVHGLLFTPDGSRLIVTASEPAHVRVWDLRLVRSELAKMGLDWDAPPYPAAPAIEAEPTALKVEMQLVDLIEQAARKKQGQADEHRLRKEYAEAIACYREVLKIEPHNAWLLNRVAWLMAIGPAAAFDPTESLRLSQQACEIEPSSAYFLNTRGAAQYRAGHHAAALESLRRAEKLFAGNKTFVWPYNWLLQALCHAKLGDRHAAEAAYDKSLHWLKQPRKINAVERQEALLLQQEVETLLADRR